MKKTIILLLLILTTFGIVSCEQKKNDNQSNKADVEKLFFLKHHPIHSSQYGPVIYTISDAKKINSFLGLINSGKATNENWINFMNDTLSIKKYDVQKEENKNWIVIEIYEDPLKVKYCYINQKDNKDSIVYSVEDSDIINSFLNSFEDE